jgi:hypothetical protein
MSEIYDADNARLIQAIRATGRPALTPAELRHINHGAELLSDLLAVEWDSGWPNQAIADGMAVEAINAWNSYRRKRDGHGARRYNPIGRKPVRRDRNQPSLDDPFSMIKVLCIVAHLPQKAYPLDDIIDWKLVFPGKIWWPFYGCDARTARRCHKSFALSRVAFKRGEFMTVHNVCEPCYRWMYAHTTELVDRYRDHLPEHHIEPTAEVRQTQLIRLAERGVL